MRKPFIKKVPYQGTPELKLALFSDLHLASGPDVDMVAMKRDFERACNEDREILINGDIAEQILPGDKKRWTANKMNSNRDDVLNEQLDMCYEFLKPYANNISLIGRGNHDISPIKYDSFDLVGALIGMLNRDKDNGNIYSAGYQGYVQYKMTPNTKKRGNTNFTLYMHHGAGGSAPVSKGMIDFNRIVYSHNADLYWLGHKHVSTVDNGIIRDGVDRGGNYFQKVCKAVITPGYKQSFIDKGKGYRTSYSDTFYNMQAKGFATCDVYVDRNAQKLATFDVTMHT